MATSTEIKQRANTLADKTDVNSITPKEVGGIMYDLASHGENVLRNGGTLGIRKVYESVAAMEADSTNPKDFWGDPIKKGNLVVIYDGTTTGVDNNKIYAFMKPGWELATKLDAAYATKAETDAKLSELGSEVLNIASTTPDFITNKLVWFETTSDNVGGSIASSVGFVCTDYIPLDNVIKIIADIRNYTATVAAIAYYDASYNYLGGISQISSKKILSSDDFVKNAKYVKLCNSTNAFPTYIAHIEYKVVNYVDEKIREATNLINKDIQKKTISKTVTLSKKGVVWLETTSDHAGGDIAITESHLYSDLLSLNSILKITSRCANYTNTVAAIAYYDDNYNYLGGISQIVPNEIVDRGRFIGGAKFVRLCCSSVASSIFEYELEISVSEQVSYTTDFNTTLQLELYKKETITPDFITNKLVWFETTSDNVGGSIASSGGFVCTDYIPLDNVIKIIADIRNYTATVAAIAYYDASYNYLGGISQISSKKILPSDDFIKASKYIRLCNSTNAYPTYSASVIYDDSIIVNVEKNKKSIEELRRSIEIGKVWAVCGDSITHANHEGIDDILENDAFLPFANTKGIPSGIASIYKRKNYAYYIAKKYGLRWANYGWGGTTLHNCSYNGNFLNGFSVDRYKELAEGVDFDYISIFFGYNDAIFGVYAQKEKWLSDKYGKTIYYPTNSSDVGTGLFATQSQKDEVDSVIGMVNGVEYTDNKSYFMAKMIGTINDSDNSTWYGAFNVILPYLIKKYPTAKILLVVPYSITYDNVNESGPNEQQKNAVVEVAKKWGVGYYDFREKCPFLEQNNNYIEGFVNLRDFREKTLTADRLHPNNDGYKYIYPSIGESLLSL